MPEFPGTGFRAFGAFLSLILAAAALPLCNRMRVQAGVILSSTSLANSTSP